MSSQGDVPVPEPSALQKFIEQPASYTSESRVIGRIDDPAAQLIVTALVVSNGVIPPYKMQGIRIDLINETKRDQVYLAQQELDTIRAGIEKIDTEMVSFRDSKTGNDGMQCLGAAEFWHPDRRIHTLNVAYCVTSQSEWLNISANTSQNWKFLPQTGSRLAALLMQAKRDLLSTHSNHRVSGSSCSDCASEIIGAAY
jgi:hypothetical protein